MAFSTTALKRQKELARLDRKQKKARKAEQRQADSEQRRQSCAPGVDPDLEGIIPGPQPRLFD